MWTCLLLASPPLPVVFLPDRGLPRHGRTGTQLASGSMQICISPVSMLAQTLCKVREDEEQVLLVARLATRTGFPNSFSRDSHSLRIPLRKDIISQGLGTFAPRQTCGTSMCGSGRDAARLERSPTGVVETITQARALLQESIRPEVESVREMVFFSREDPEEHDWSSAFFPTRKVGSVGCHNPP